MSQEDQNPKPTHVETAAAGESGKHNSAQPDHRKDPDEYDPVGMAGKPAGILLELGEEATDEAKAKEKAAAQEGKTADQARPDRKDQ